MDFQGEKRHAYMSASRKHLALDILDVVQPIMGNLGQPRGTLATGAYLGLDSLGGQGPMATMITGVHPAVDSQNKKAMKLF